MELYGKIFQYFSKLKSPSQALWLMPAIPAIQEAEIGRMAV
jgi:hypothetical protein